MRDSTVRVVVLGGGNGISAVLGGLARSARSGADLDVTAVVATADDGGSSGRIRKQRGGLPPGDLRRCLVALAGSADEPLTRLFAHRYDGEGELGGHAVGNLILLALAEQHGGYSEALRVASELLRVRGRVLPVSLESVRLLGTTRDGRALRGESTIGNAPAAMANVRLRPADVEPAPDVLAAIERADLVVVGPGSLFTSLLPVLLVRGVADAIRACGGLRVLVANLMTQPGETLGMDLDQHLAAIDGHVGPGLVRHVLVNDQALSPDRLRSYARKASSPVGGLLGTHRPETVLRAPIATARGKVRHEPDRLARALLAAVDAARGTAGRRALVDVVVVGREETR
jgi:uncharacterized cofD-like protein